ncbi:MAG: 2-C-methyl-D-erythritol 4-phosphate cytidylyltransferase [Firmicutes bacterium]|nr:2-C-methyl-D-erythritol 4-phosphate cytidylyltransferase [Bacillota bacterium]
MIFAGIVAGGTGTRLGGEIPKQFLLLGIKPIIVHTLEKFMLCSKFDAIFVGVHESWLPYATDILKKFNINDCRIFFTSGGYDRNLTIMNIISAIEEKFNVSDEHVLVTHDAVRPFVTLKIIEENIISVQKMGACDTVVKSNDTIIESNLNKTMILKVPNREYMFLGQTPQSFNMSKLKKLYYQLSEKEKSDLTDACKIFVIKNEPVELVMGEFSNIKITTVSDYKTAQSLLGAKFD